MLLLQHTKSLHLCKFAELTFKVYRSFQFFFLYFRNSNLQLKVRLGEWDASASAEPLAAQEFFVQRIFVHPQYSSANLRNNIALLRLSSAVPLGLVPTITTACLPSNLLGNTRCWVAGKFTKFKRKRKTDETFIRLGKKWFLEQWRLSGYSKGSWCSINWSKHLSDTASSHSSWFKLSTWQHKLHMCWRRSWKR